jgi:deoxyribodipyrimidine photo-lyase
MRCRRFRQRRTPSYDTNIPGYRDAGWRGYVMSSTAIVWLRRDLRLADNPALTVASRTCDRIIPVYIHAPAEENPWQPGAASRWWLHHSLRALEDSLRRRGSRLVVRTGTSLAMLQELLAGSGARAVYWNRLYEPALQARDNAIKECLQDQGIEVGIFNATLLFEPGEISRGDGGPYRVFTPFSKACLARDTMLPTPAPTGRLPTFRGLTTTDLEELGLLPSRPWYRGFESTWSPGENSAWQLLERFLDTALGDYPAGRDRLDCSATSRLSPHLHFGEIGPRQIWQTLEQLRLHDPRPGLLAAVETFQRQLLWREFAHHLLQHFPATPGEPLYARYQTFPWREDHDQLSTWRRGQTGIPLVDAGMRELWGTGFMHNRARMVVASFLTKNLGLHWLQGARWFWDTLVDADLANNTLGWQWAAGCGADAAPYFRIFNPVRQGERFDPEGAYVRRWVPELARLPNRAIHHPWDAPPEVSADAGPKGGNDYPPPVVDLESSRKQALERYADWKRWSEIAD